MRAVLRSAPVLHSAVATRRGPHLTPTVFSWAAGRLWLVASRHSVKVRVLRADPRVGLLLTDGSRQVVGAGVATVWDALPGAPWPGPGELARGPLGAARYLTENLGHALAVVADHPTPALLVDRVAVSITPERLALVDGADLVDQWGKWPAEPDAARTPADAAPGAGAPLTPLAPDLLAADGPAQLGWSTPHGPLALPSRWHAERGEAELPATLLDLAGAPPEGPACLTVTTSGHRMSDKRGALLRGHGTARRAGDRATVRLRPVTVTTWHGRHVNTTRTGV
jgi:hypothetical protein